MKLHKVLGLALPAMGLASVLGLVLTASVSAQTISNAGQTCTSSDPNGIAPPGPQVVCQVSTPSQLTPGAVLFVEPPNVAGTTPLQCLGESGYGYTTQGSVATLPAALGWPYTGTNGCEFTVTSGVVPAYAGVGAEVVQLPYYGFSAPLQLNAVACDTPWCGTVLSSQPLSQPQWNTSTWHDNDHRNGMSGFPSQWSANDPHNDGDTHNWQQHDNQWNNGQSNNSGDTHNWQQHDGQSGDGHQPHSGQSGQQPSGDHQGQDHDHTSGH